MPDTSIFSFFLQMFPKGLFSRVVKSQDCVVMGESIVKQSELLAGLSWFILEHPRCSRYQKGFIPVLGSQLGQFVQGISRRL